MNSLLRLRKTRNQKGPPAQPLISPKGGGNISH